MEKCQITSWLETILEHENLTDLTVDKVGNAEKEDGYLGDILFTCVTGKTKEGSRKDYNIVLKYSKQNKTARENSPVQDAFFNEMYLYTTVLPIFTKFQLEKGIKETFNSVANCYGAFTSTNLEVIVLENLKNCGYFLWDKKDPLPRKHLDMVVREYGKFHAISVAMKEQQTVEFNEICGNLKDLFKPFVKSGDIDALFGSNIQDTYDVLRNDLDEHILTKWISFKQQIQFVFKDMINNFEGPTVITHGDGWNDNFMFYSDTDDKFHPSKVAILDWQVTKCSSPIFNLSFFLFSCISEEDIQDLDRILEDYHHSLSYYLRLLGSNPNALYPLNQFLSEWKKLCKFGILMSTIVIKLCTTDKDEVPDMVQTVEKGSDFTRTFMVQVKDKTLLRNRMRHIVKYVVEKDLIS